MNVGAAIAVRRIALERCFEFVAPAAVGGTLVDLGLEPGAVQRDAAGRATLLSIAPRRWLVPAPAPELLARLSSLEAQGVGSLVDVEGKWQALALDGDARRVLESSLNIEEALAGRSCAAVVLFDCPAILARVGEAFELWVAASYVDGFLTAVGAMPPAE